jgi:hypothetical protein
VTLEETLHTQYFGRQSGTDRGAPKGDKRGFKAGREEIAQLAYVYWQERQKNRIAGSDIADWLRAEAEILRSQEAAEREASIDEASEDDEASEESFPASDPPAW